LTRSNRSRSLQVDVSCIFWRSFWFLLLVCQFAIWQRLKAILPRGMGRRNLLVHMLVPSAIWGLLVATLTAAAVTLATFLVFKVLVGPILRSWLTPTIDPMTALFHLAPGEASLASIPGRRLWGWSWQSGALVVTDRRIWFIPTSWNLEPWSASRSEIAGCDADLPAVLGLLPIRNWPEPVRLRMRGGCQCTFVVANPDELLEWFEPGGLTERVAKPARNVLGAFDV
jgi:hypothetical protein